jgi:membrane protein implicated in regulation of membrane protease activity
MERLTVKEAADRLRISQGAVRKRIQRGTIPNARRSDGSVYVFLDSDTEDVSRESGLESEDPLTLNYIDKLYSSWHSVSNSIRRLGFVMVVLCLLLLILSAGAASAEQKLTLSGIGLKIPFVLFLVVGAVSILVIVSVLSPAEDEKYKLEEEIIRLYGELGLDDSTLAKAGSDAEPGPFRSGDPVHTFSTSFGAGGLGDWVAVCVYIIAPVAAQVAVGFKVADLVQKQGFGWVWIPFFVLAVITGTRMFGMEGLTLGEQDHTSMDIAINFLLFFLLYVVPAFILGFVLTKGLPFL